MELQDIMFNDDELSLTNEEEEFLLKYRRLTSNNKDEIKDYIFSFGSDDSEAEE